MLQGSLYEAMLENNAHATYSCKHKITKKPICAIPCNGLAEMCENDEDEQCQGPGISIILCCTFVLAIIFLLVAYLTDVVLNTKSQIIEPVDEMEMGKIGEDAERYNIDILKSKLSTCSYRLDFEGAVQLVDKYYNENRSIKESVDEYFMDVLGTNKLTAFYYDCVDSSLLVKIGIFLQRKIPGLFQAIVRYHIQNVWDVIKCVVNISVRYTDLPKDTLLLYMVWIRLGNNDYISFPMSIFWILLSTIIAAEILHCFTIMHHHSTQNGRKVLILLMTPLMPAFYLYQRLKIKLILRSLWKLSTNLQAMNEEMKNNESKCNELELLNAKMQCTENVLENLTQLIVLIMLISLTHTSTRAVENIEALFVDDNAILGYIFVILSFISVIRGQLTYLKASKNGCLSLTGTLGLIPYFMIGTCSRLLSMLLLFTPSLGLFDVLHHGRLASISVKQDEHFLDRSADEVPPTFVDAWEPFKIKDIQSFRGIPMSGVLSIMVAVCLLHIFVSTCIMKFTLRGKFSSTLLMQGLHSFIAPPLQFDWEFLYRRNKPNSSVIDCWRR